MEQPGRPAGARDGFRFPRWRDLSIEHKLPLLMTAVLVVVLGASLLLTSGALARGAETAMRDRIQGTVQRTAASIEDANRRVGTTLLAAAAHPDVAAMLVAPTGARSDSIAAARALDAAVLPRVDSTLALLVLDTAGRPVVARVPAGAADMVELSRTVRAAATDTLLSEALRHSHFLAAGEAVHHWTVVPVVARHARIGYLAQLRRVAGQPSGQAAFDVLFGPDADLYLRHADGAGAWAIMPGVPGRAPARRDSTPAGVVHLRGGVGELIAVEAEIEGAPWVVGIESPRAPLRAAARETLRTLAVVSVLLIAAGTALSGIISRGLTRPLSALTTATEEVARGEVATPRLAAGGDEIGRLATTFEHMASEVAAARRELEGRVAESQAAAAALERTNERLQLAVEETDHARREAERANRAKSDFLAVMSHELRTPLNAIGGYTQLLELGIHGPVTEAQQDTLARITRNQTHLLRLINDVLNFAKIDAGQVDFAIGGVPLDAALAGVEALVAPQMRAKRLTFTHAPVDPSVVVCVDRERLQQIVLNLLANAVKFTPPGGTVRLAGDVADGMARVTVADTGVGIPPEHLATIFDPFVQGDRALNRPHEGVGLGLAISRDLARGMGGELTAASVVGEGSVFTLTLPVEAGADVDGDRGWAEREAGGRTAPTF